MLLKEKFLIRLKDQTSKANSVNRFSNSLVKGQVAKRRTGADSDTRNVKANRPAQIVCEGEVFDLSISRLH